MKTLKEKIEVMQAALDGKEVERRTHKSKVYCETEGEQTWNWADNDYRIKPTPMEFSITIRDGHVTAINWDSEKYPFVENKTVKAREVIE